MLGVAPPDKFPPDVAVLEVTGDDVGEADAQFTRELCSAVGLPVFTLFQVPNQPLWGLREDDLIAHTFLEFLSSGEPNWPLLDPMVRSVTAALDFVCDRTPARRFVVTGASKRGWTCWLAAASGDERIVGVAPRVFDNLDLAAQAEKQATDWGGYSPMVDDYSNRSLQSLAETPAGQALLDLVDPVRLLDRVRVPQLLVHGTNDPYWTVDALALYWDRLKDARAVIVPNEGHGLAPESGWMEALAAFAHSCFMGRLLPEVAARHHDSDSEVLVSEPAWGEVWMAQAEDLQFGQALWRRVSEGWAPGRLPCKSGPNPGARMARAWFAGPAGPYALSTPVHVGYESPRRELKGGGSASKGASATQGDEASDPRKGTRAGILSMSRFDQCLVHCFSPSPWCPEWDSNPHDLTANGF